VTSWFDARVLDRWRVTAESLAFLRVLFASVALLVGFPDWRWTTDLPHALWAPPLGPMRLLPAAPPAPALLLVQVMYGVALMALLVGCRTFAASWGVALLGTFGSGVVYSSGNYEHGWLPFFMAAVMSFSGWGSAWSVDAARGRAPGVQPWPVAFLAWGLGLSMLSAAIPKLEAGWLHLGTHAVRGHLVDEYVVNHRRDLLAGQAMSITSGPLWEVLDYLTIVLEGGFVLAVLTVRGTRVFAAGAALFHLVVMLVMDIAFLSNTLVYASFVDWTPVARRLHVSGAWLRHRLVPAGVLLAGVGWAALSAQTGPPLVALVGLVTDRANLLVHLALLTVSGAVALTYLAREGWAVGRAALPARA